MQRGNHSVLDQRPGSATGQVTAALSKLAAGATVLWLTEDNLADYLRRSGRLAPDEAVEVRELTGGVSNVVLYVRRLHAAGGDLVVKQAREQLRVAQPWFSPLERIWREVDVMRWCHRLLATERGANGDSADETTATALSPALPAATTPEILWEDRKQFCFAMSAAPPNHTTWKARLLAGEFDTAIAAACGTLLGTLHGRSWGQPELAEALGDRRLFDDLRLDPYYRTVARQYPQFAEPLLRLVDSVADHAVALTHADFSPKNLLVYPGGLMMVDFETGHYGDPAFDLGFFLSHLVLKTHYHAARDGRSAAECKALIATFWQHYLPQLPEQVSSKEKNALVARGIQHLAGCAWARLDGKSPVDYLGDVPSRDAIRRACQTILGDDVTQWDDAAALLLPAF